MKKVDDWIACHEPKINMMQKRIESLENEIQEKVSYTMVQSMIGQANDGTITGRAQPERGAFKESRLSNYQGADNFRSAPAVDAEDSVGKATEGFGGYDLNDDPVGNSGLSRHKVGYERPGEESMLEQSALKQRAAQNINESATPIKLS